MEPAKPVPKHNTTMAFVFLEFSRDYDFASAALAAPEPLLGATGKLVGAERFELSTSTSRT